MIQIEATPARIAVATTLDANSVPDSDDYYETITKVIPSHEQVGYGIIRSHVPDLLHINNTENPSIIIPSIPGLQKANPSAKTLFGSKRAKDFVTAMDR